MNVLFFNFFVVSFKNCHSLKEKGEHHTQSLRNKKKTNKQMETTESFEQKYPNSFWFSEDDNKGKVWPKVELWLFDEEKDTFNKVLLRDLAYIVNTYTSFTEFTVNKDDSAENVISFICEKLAENLKEGKILSLNYHIIEKDNQIVKFQRLRSSDGYLVFFSTTEIKKPPSPSLGMFRFRNLTSALLSYKIATIPLVEEEQAQVKTINPPAEEPENNTNKNDKICVVCMDNPSEVIITNCGHFGLCASCAQRMKACPACRKPFTPKQVIKVYTL